MINTTPSTVTVDLSGLHRFGAAVESGLRGGSGPFKTMYTQWAARYRSFVQERFDLYSRGGGDWPPLKNKRRHGRGTRERASVLRDTNTMFRALNPTFASLPGQYEQQIQYGVEVGFGGLASHPSTEGQITVSDLARIHHLGLGRVPARKIIVEPSQRVVDAMAGDAERALQKLGA